MKGVTVILDQLNGRKAAALLRDGKLDDLLIDAPEGTPLPGAIYRAKVERQVKGQGGVFLTLPDGDTAFLRQAKGLSPGQALLVMVTGYAEGGKAVPVTPRVLFKSRYAIITPNAPGLNISRAIRDDEERDRLLELAHEGMDGLDEGFGLILRSACAGADADDIADDIAAMRDLAVAVMEDQTGEPDLLVDGADAHHLAWRDWAEVREQDVIARDGGFDDFGVLDSLIGLTHGVGLSGGGKMYVEPTRALVAVDVNTGGDTSPAAGLKANIAAAKDLPRVLRLMGLAGQVVVDFAPMPKKDRRVVEQSLRAAFRQDGIETTQIGWTAMGCFEMTRKRERLPIDIAGLE